MESTVSQFAAGQWAPYLSTDSQLLSARFVEAGTGSRDKAHVEIAEKGGKTVARRSMEKEQAVRWFREVLSAQGATVQPDLF